MRSSSGTHTFAVLSSALMMLQLGPQPTWSPCCSEPNPPVARGETRHEMTEKGEAGGQRSYEKIDTPTPASPCGIQQIVAPGMRQVYSSGGHRLILCGLDLSCLGARGAEEQAVRFRTWPRLRLCAQQQDKKRRNLQVLHADTVVFAKNFA